MNFDLNMYLFSKLEVNHDKSCLDDCVFFTPDNIPRKCFQNFIGDELSIFIVEYFTKSPLGCFLHLLRAKTKKEKVLTVNWSL